MAKDRYYIELNSFDSIIVIKALGLMAASVECDEIDRSCALKLRNYFKNEMSFMLGADSK